MSRSRSPRPVQLALSGLLVAAMLAVAPPPAQAAVKMPTGLSPTGPTASSTPTFTWNRVSGATSYQLQVDDSSTFASPVATTETANNKYVPTAPLPNGQIFWRVRTVSPSGTSAYANANATIAPTAAPSPVSPVGGVTLSQPDSPPQFTWSPVTGAVGYEIQVDNTGTWTSPGAYTASGTSYFVDTPQAPGTWHWRVRANRGSGLFTAWSNGADYVVGQLADPQPGADMNSATPVQDVSIDWQPVPGATNYQLQVGRDPDFNNIVDDRIVDGTRFQPSVTYGNDQYYWRVRAIDAGGNRMPWTQASPFTFQRNWPQKPILQYPLNQFAPTVGNPMYYQWTPVRHTTQYQLDVGGDPNFSPGTFATCVTSGTTLPVNGACTPLGQGATTYWRVKALDGPSGVEGIYSQIFHFVYSAGQLTQTAPANGATVDVPTLAWNPLAGTQTYHVVVKDKDGNVATGTDTSSTTWTPEALLPTTGNPYTWTVQSTPAQGPSSPLYPGRTFSVSGTTVSTVAAPKPVTGLPGGPATSDFPSLTWTAQINATYYRVRIGVQGSNFYDDPNNTSHINATLYGYTAATDTGTHYLSPGTYFWFVDAYSSTNQLIGETAPADYGQFSIKDLAATTGQKVALDGIAGQNPSAGCTNALSNIDTNSQICVGVPATPILKWDPEPRAAGYLVYLANDQELTNRVVNPYAVTTNTMWRPPSDLPDNTAQDSYYWFIRPCKSFAPLQCNPDPISTNAAASNAFRKLSPAIQLTAPADAGSVAANPTFTWSDYYDTNQGISYANGADKSYQTAQTYRIQISQSPTFNSVVDDETLDQPFYTPSALTLPQGNLYWRVQAIDPAGNRLNYSAVHSFSNDQPAISLAATGSNVPSPVGGTTVAGSTPFRWAPRNGAALYTIEVYRNDDATHSPANLVFSANTREPGFAWQSYIPPSSSAYRWRVRWMDAGNQPRPWSADGRFMVGAGSVTLHAPAAGTYQKNNNLLFTWVAVPFAASYRVDVRDANQNNVFSSTTAATALAPSLVGDGKLQWRVTALDPSGGAIAVSTWRTFKVDSVSPVVTSYSPNPTGSPKSKVKAIWNEKVSGVTTTSFSLHVAGRTSRLPAKVKLSKSHLKAILTPNQHLKKGKTYTVKLKKSIHDGAGNHMSAFTWTFTV